MSDKSQRGLLRLGSQTTYTRSILLNLALFTSSLLFPFKAAARTSLPICSPSRSQSVQMKSALADRAWASMFLATAFLSYNPCKKVCEARHRHTNVCYTNLYRCIKQSGWRRMTPVSILRWEFKSSQVSDDTCHRYPTIAPRRAKVKVKFIILYKWVTID